jgi:6-phosphogluconolactonase
VYVSDTQNNQVDGFAGSKADGTLTRLSGSPFSLPLVGSSFFPQGMATDPLGKFLYVANIGIDELAIDGTTGDLTAIPGSPVHENNASFLTVDPSGSFLFADGNSGILAFTIDTNSGALTLVAGSPFPFPINTIACRLRPCLL